MANKKSRSADRQRTDVQLDEIISSAEELSLEIDRKQEASPMHLTRLARLLSAVARHVKALRVQRRREEEEDPAWDKRA